MKDIAKEIQARLFALQDLQYRDFQCRLIPSVSPDRVIGVRTPALRKLAKALAREASGKPAAMASGSPTGDGSGTPAAMASGSPTGEVSGKPASSQITAADLDAFLQILPHTYYDENNLHGFLIGTVKDYAQAVAAVDAFLPFVDNWATCDLMSPKVFKKHPEELLGKIREWIASDRTYTIRFGIEMLMSFYLDDLFLPAYLELVAPLRSEEYYVNMMIAWFFATALAKQWDAAIPFIDQHRLDDWTHKKAIQKSIESYRITDEQKTYLRTLR